MAAANQFFHMFRKNSENETLQIYEKQLFLNPSSHKREFKVNLWQFCKSRPWKNRSWHLHRSDHCFVHFHPGAALEIHLVAQCQFFLVMAWSFMYDSSQSHTTAVMTCEKQPLWWLPVAVSRRRMDKNALCVEQDIYYISGDQMKRSRLGWD